MQILVVEDDPAIAAMIRQGLENAHYSVQIAADGLTGLQLALEENFQLVILDVMLPGMNGWQICERLRQRKIRVPVLMLSARGLVDDRIRGLDSGADDYLPKPFEFGELLARIRALLRRELVHRTQKIQIADLVIDTVQRRVIRAGVEIGLSHREYDLLVALAAREGHVFSRERIQETVWGNEEATSNTVAVYIGLLRKKIDTGHEQKLIHTIYGAGYTLRVSTGEADPPT
jgi:DNA-binding response OmpR family regulator